MLFKEYCILPFYQNRANQGIVINKKSSYCKDRANQGRLNQGLTVLIYQVKSDIGNFEINSVTILRVDDQPLYFY